MRFSFSFWILFLFSTLAKARVFTDDINVNPSPEPSSPRSDPSGPTAPVPVPVSHDGYIVFFDVTSFGAVGDCVADDTSAFKMAWDSACERSSPELSVVLVPYSFCFLVNPAIFNGPCNSQLVLQIDGIIVPPEGPESWPWNNKRQWLMFYRVHGLSLQGSGVINGRGQKWWDLPCKPHKGINGTIQTGSCDSPVAVRFFQSSNLTIRGLSFKDSPQFHVRFDNCSDVLVDSVAIKAPASSPNTDGIHIENTNNVQIHNSVISSGDDCISIGARCFNVDIQNITCGPSHGISIGSLGVHNSRACVSNITVTNSTIRDSDNGVRIKTWQGGSGTVSRIVFSNILMDNVRNPIIIDQYYCQTKNCTNQTSAVLVSDVLYAHIKGTYNLKSPPMHFACSDSVPCTDLKLADVELFPSKGQILANPFCWNAYGSVQTLTIPPVYCLLEQFPGLVTEEDALGC
ncbi:PREDICTED: polygalacturonase At1g48100 [Tarenaya hassleriana]|uniref:polygalacturonase At1g48100 n=1 Tax=Tarenaya hassleriana TaxID=28532 RepID=UPI00053CA3CF|nr:PREDICTED: polygalacturonase At1g48100 [Tarenaya hassleriana]